MSTKELKSTSDDQHHEISCPIAYLWFYDHATRAWSALPVDGEALTLLPASARPRQAVGLFRSRKHWVMFAGSATRVNARPVCGGLHIVRDRDAIQPDGAYPIFLSTRQAPRVGVFPGQERNVYCPRCKLVLEPGCNAVRCPNPDCNTWSHQQGDLLCWSYDEGCAACGHPTAIDDAGWTPEDL